jgi:hypothetical protein
MYQFTCLIAPSGSMARSSQLSTMLMKIKENDVDRGIQKSGQCGMQRGSRGVKACLFQTKSGKLGLSWLRCPSENHMRPRYALFHTIGT